MSDVPVAAAGAITVALIVVLGIFVYPALLGRPLGKAVVTLATALLAVLFFMFDRARGLSAHPAASGGVVALAPLVAGVIVHRLTRRGSG